MRLIVSEQAESDLRAIYRYTYAEWGVTQADAYVESFDDAFALLEQFPGLARRREDIPPPYLVYVHKRHLLLCKQREALLEVLAVLHQNMNILARIREMLGNAS